MRDMLFRWNILLFGQLARPTLAAMFLLLVGVLLVSCSSSGPVDEAAPQDSARIDGVTYARGSFGNSEEISARFVKQRAPVGKIEKQLSSYDLQDGQATGLGPGTSLYAVRGYDTSFRLAARTQITNKDGKTGEAWALYEVGSNKDAKSAADLLDVRNKVDYVSLEIFGTTEETASVGNANSRLGIEESGDLTNTALDSTLRRVSSAELNGLLTIHLKDGTRTVRVYDPHSGELSLGESSGAVVGVMLPEEYRRLLTPASER